MATRWPCSPRCFPEKEDHVLVALTGRTVGAAARLVPSPSCCALLLAEQAEC